MLAFRPIDPAIRPETWRLGSLSSALAGPLSDRLSAVITARADEEAFLFASFAKRHALLAAIDLGRDDDGHDLQDLWRRGLDAQELLESVLGDRIEGLVAALSRLGPEPPILGAYGALIGVLGEKGVGARTLTVLPTLTFARILILAALPDWLRRPAVLEAMRTPIDAVGIASAAEYALQSGAFSSEAEVVRALVKYGREFTSALLSRSRYVKPPWDGTSRLKPISDLEELQALGRELNNCLGRSFYREMAAQGTYAFYVWSGDETAVVKLDRVGPEAWILGEVRGQSNAAVSSATVAAIARELPGRVIYAQTGF